jgi:glycosyltransferase involved in cell wall biosynthesis
MEPEEPVNQFPRRKISLVVPFFNEEESVDFFAAELSKLLNSIREIDWEVVCVNDGSRDATFDKLGALSQADRRFFIVDLARNFG